MRKTIKEYLLRQVETDREEKVSRQGAGAGILGRVVKTASEKVSVEQKPD